MSEDEKLIFRCSSNWMSELPSALWEEALWNLAIPGSHDTMTYCLDQRSSVLPSEPRLLRALDALCPCFVRPCIMKWAKTQESSISNQLDSGIRFLDLRVAHKTKDPDVILYFAHGFYSLLTLKEALAKVIQWLDLHPKEVLILSLSAFDGMNLDQHTELIHFLVTTFGHKICPNSVTPSLKECWDHKYQVILSYDDSSAYGHEELWPKCDYWWANTSDPSQVITYLEQKKRDGRPGGFFAAGLNLTEDTRYVLSHPCQSMRGMTLNWYNLLLDWVKQQQPGSGETCLNIICADFVEAQLNAMHLSRLQTAASSSRPAYLSLWPQRGEARPCSRSSPGEGKEDGFRAKTVTFERQIHSIPTIPEVHEPLEKKARFRSRNVMSLSDADSVCLICHDDMRRGGGGGAIRDLHCSHSFHRECIEEWLWTKQTCPTCHKHVAMPEPLYWTSTRVIVP